MTRTGGGEDFVGIAHDFHAVRPAESAERCRGKATQLRRNAEQRGFRLPHGPVDNAPHGVLHLQVLNRPDVIGNIDEADVEPGGFAPVGLRRIDRLHPGEHFDRLKRVEVAPPERVRALCLRPHPSVGRAVEAMLARN